jgi:hypothetical protein
MALQGSVTASIKTEPEEDLTVEITRMNTPSSNNITSCEAATLPSDQPTNNRLNIMPSTMELNREPAAHVPCFESAAATASHSHKSANMTNNEGGEKSANLANDDGAIGNTSSITTAENGGAVVKEEPVALKEEPVSDDEEQAAAADGVQQPVKEKPSRCAICLVTCCQKDKKKLSKVRYCTYIFIFTVYVLYRYMKIFLFYFIFYQVSNRCQYCANSICRQHLFVTCQICDPAALSATVAVATSPAF